MAKRVTSPATMALKDALCAVYWYKIDLQGFLQQSLINPAILSTLNWRNYKRQIVSDLVDLLTLNPDKYLGDLARLCHETSKVKSFIHLEKLDGGVEKAKRARAAVTHLKNLMTHLS